MIGWPLTTAAIASAGGGVSTIGTGGALGGGMFSPVFGDCATARLPTRLNAIRTGQKRSLASMESGPPRACRARQAGHRGAPRGRAVLLEDADCSEAGKWRR